MCRIYIVADQCYSGGFVSVSVNRPSISVYSVANPDEPAYAEDNFATKWCAEDPGEKTMDQIFDSLGPFLSGKMRSHNESGQHKLCECCDPTLGVRGSTWGTVKIMYR